MTPTAIIIRSSEKPLRFISGLMTPSPPRGAVAPSLWASSIAVRAHFVDVCGGLRAAGLAAITLWQP